MGFDLTDKNNFSLYDGTGMSPVFTEEGDYRKAYSSVKPKNWASQYLGKFAEANHIASAAKVYIVDNWEKIDDWSGLEVTLRHRGDPETEVTFFNYNIHSNFADRKNAGNGTIAKAFKRIDEKNKEKHNPVETFGEPVLDTHDGDFSVTVNDKEFWWIGDKAVITIAHYIEYKLDKDNEEK